MKRTIFSIVFAALTMGAAAQCADSACAKCDSACAKCDSTKSEVYCDKLDQQPRFPGGEKALLEYFSKNLRYPELAEKYGVEGNVIMSFIVDTDGKISGISASDCTIERFNTTKFSLETEAKQKELKEQFALLFAKEGARVVRSMPNWEPGMLNGKKVRVRYHLPIRFSIPNK